MRGGGRLISMGKNQCVRTYQYIISLENLLEAWQEFLRGKRRRRDVQEFERDLMGNILSLHDVKFMVRNYGIVIPSGCDANLDDHYISSHK